MTEHDADLISMVGTIESVCTMRDGTIDLGDRKRLAQVARVGDDGLDELIGEALDIVRSESNADSLR